MLAEQMPKAACGVVMTRKVESHSGNDLSIVLDAELVRHIAYESELQQSIQA